MGFLKIFFSLPGRLHAESAAKAQIPGSEMAAGCLALALCLSWKALFVFYYHFDTDETQHLHVVWGWANGFLQYRDIFDNHAPLFHMLYAPLLMLLGESTSTVFAMRMTMIPLYCITLWCVFLIGRELFSARYGLWAAVLTAFYPFCFILSGTFRTDNLWAMFWMLSLALLICGKLTSAKCFWAGFFLGTALGVSMKTTLLLGSLGGGALAVVVLSPRQYISRQARGRFGKFTAALLAGLCIVPAALVLVFYFKDALAPLYYGTVQHNILHGLGKWHKQAYLRMLIFPVSLIALYAIAQIMGKKTALASLRTRRIFILFVCGIYFFALNAFWPVIDAQSYLPFYPLLGVLLTPVFLKLLPEGILHIARCNPLSSPPQRIIAACMVFIEIICILGIAQEVAPRQERLTKQVNLISDILRLTGPHDPVADMKGETVFRPRSSYYVLETITRARIKRGLMNDDIPERLLDTRTCVAALDDIRLPSRARIFLNENYIPVGSLRVAGKLLSPPSDAAQPVTFSIGIPAPYIIVAQNGSTVGQLDGKPYDGSACFLEAGQHEFRPAAQNGKLAVVWAKAKTLGYSPFS